RARRRRGARAGRGRGWGGAGAGGPGLPPRPERGGARRPPAPAWESAPPMRCVLVEDDAGPRGSALFTSEGRWEWEEGTFLPAGVLDVHEAIATDPAAAVALWGNVLNRDLITTFRLHMLAVDDPLLDLLADSRLGRPRLSDGLWVRLVDVPRALAQRHYARPVDLVIEVTDELTPGNQGRWRVAPGRGVGGLPRRGVCRNLRADHRAGRPGAAGARARRGVPGRHQARAAGRGGTGHRGHARFRRRAVGGHVLGPGAVVPDDLLTSAGNAGTSNSDARSTASPRSAG